MSSNLFLDPVLSKIRSYRQHEGDRFTIFREDGTRATSDQKLIRSELITLDLKEIQVRGERAIFEGFAPAREQLAITGRKMIGDKIDQDSPHVDAAGRPFPEVFLEMLEKMDLSFDDNGTWQEPEFVPPHPNPQLIARLIAGRKRFDNEPILKEKLDALLTRKRQDWNDREANRKLVD
jgi:hypothetical protein